MKLFSTQYVNEQTGKIKILLKPFLFSNKIHECNFSESIRYFFYSVQYIFVVELPLSRYRGGCGNRGYKTLRSKPKDKPPEQPAPTWAGAMKRGQRVSFFKHSFNFYSFLKLFRSRIINGCNKSCHIFSFCCSMIDYYPSFFYSFL